MSELLPCPFCGGEAETWDGTGLWHVICTKCGTICSPCLTEAEAIEAWNTRAERTCECIKCVYFENKSTCGAYCDYFDRELGDDYDGGCTWGAEVGE